MTDDELAALPAEAVAELWRERGARLEDDLLFRWQALSHILACRAAFESGDKRAFMDAIDTCARWQIVIPPWAASAFSGGYAKVRSLKSGSWDDVFGRPFAKGIHLQRSRKRREVGPAVYLAVEEVRRKDPNLAIDDGLFESIGRRFNIGKTLANELYYQWKHRIEPSAAKN
jgi:hypothetical protein